MTRDLSPKRRRSRSRERDRDRRRRSRSRDRRDDRRDSRRERHRRRSYSRSRSLSSQRNKKQKLNTPEKPNSYTEADLVGKTEDEQEMMRTMGFCGFDSTKGQKVEGNDSGAVHVILKRKYRQYMNRKGGFNRPLEFVD